MICATPVNPQQHLKPLLSPENGIQIWIAHLDSFLPGEVERLFGSLDASERMRAAHFRSSQDRHRYAAAHGLLRLTLAKILGSPVTTLVLEKSAQGKPELQQSEHDQRRLKFNLSHSAGWALIAIGWDRQLGVDLEAAESLPDNDESLSKLAARVLSKGELAVWSAISSLRKRRAALLRTWTRKEAYVKATGEGLRHDLANIELPADAAPFDVPSAKQLAHRWFVHDLSVPADLTAALAVEAC